MSDSLHLVKLQWLPGRGGCARWYDVLVSLPPGVPPVLPVTPPLSIEMIEWVPTLGVAHIRETGGPKRDLQAHEIEACKAYLRRVCDPTNRPQEGHP